MLAASIATSGMLSRARIMPREELVAELGAVFPGSDLSLFIEPRANHANCLASWLAVFKEDTRESKVRCR